MVNLEELEIYKLSMEITEEIWSIITRWNYFEKDTIGKQSIRAAANISEGFGRYHYQEALYLKQKPGYKKLQIEN